MTDPNVLLISQRPELADAIDAALSCVTAQCRLLVLRGIGEAIPQIQRSGVWIVLMHVSGPRQENQLSKLARAIRETGRNAPIIAILDTNDHDARLRAMRCGAITCLARPIDVPLAAHLLDMLTVRYVLDDQSDPTVIRPATPTEQEPETVNIEPGSPSCALGTPQDSQAGDSAEKTDSVASESATPNSEGRSLRENALAAPREALDGFLVVTPKMQDLFRQFEAVAPLDTTILLNGQTGTGKTHAASVIHKLSNRKDRPFVVVECGGLSSTLLQSELFGHIRGAFTGADKNHEGKFSKVQDGTVLLDEVDCVPLEAQAKLLRVLEHRVFEPVGSNKELPFRGRVIAATNRSLPQLVEAGEFRSDLFYRLNVVDLYLPPLCNSRMAIRPLAERFLRIRCQQTGRNITGLTEEAWQALESYHWPGNIRELRNAIERAVVLCTRETIDVGDLPSAIQATARGSSSPQAADVPNRDPANQLAAARDHGEMLRLVEALERNNNNRTKAAAELGISRAALYKKLRKYGLI